LRRQEELVNELAQRWERYQQVVTQVMTSQEKVFSQAFDKMTNEFNRSFISWMDRQETFGKAMAKLWLSMENQAVQSLLKIAEQEALSIAMHQTLTHTQQLDDAKAAASGAYKSVMESGIPFPVNMVLAAAAGAAAFAATLAFEKGGIVPATLHEGEMVLPTPISKGIQGAIPAIQNFNSMMENPGVAPGGGTTTNNKTIHARPTINISGAGGGLKQEDIVAAVRRGMRLGQL
jgi:hypothetical protein